jgi:hypothetical protein
MVDEDKETYAPEPAGAPSHRDGRPDPVLIEGEASRLEQSPPEPAEAAAETSESVIARPAMDPPPPPSRTEPPARGPSRFGAFVAGAVGGAIVAALAMAGGYSFLAPKTDLAEAEGNRLSALESGAERETSALTALEKRLAALETGQKTAPPPVATGEVKDLAAKLGATDDQVSALAARLGKIEEAPAATPSGPDASALTGRIDKLEQALAAPKTETRVAPEAGAGEKSAEVAIVAEALRDKLAAGAPFPRELAALASLGVDPAKLAPLKPLVDGGPSGPALSAAFAEIAPSVLAAAAKRDQGSVGERFLDHLRGLVVVHDLSEKAGGDPDALVTQVEALSRRGDLAGALAAFARLPEPARKVAAAWAAQAGQAEAAAAALQSLREDAIGRLTAGKGQ